MTHSRNRSNTHVLRQSHFAFGQRRTVTVALGGWLDHGKYQQCTLLCAAVGTGLFEQFHVVRVHSVGLLCTRQQEMQHTG